MLKSLLFVPGDSEKKMVKARSTAASALILDLEDAVSVDRIDVARGMVKEYLSSQLERADQQLWVRINPLFSPLALADLVAVVAGAPDGILLPKIESANDVTVLDHHLTALEQRDGVAAGSIRIIPVATETPQPSRSQSGEEVLPVVPSGFHGDEHFAGSTEHIEQFLIARGILRKRRGLDLNRTVIADHRDHVSLGGNVYPRESHTTSGRRRKSGASEPVLLSALVHARNRQYQPRDTVRTLSTGRGRQSHAKGLRLSEWPATLSRIPSASILTRVIQ